jgi:hypothetical protein
MSVAIQNTDIRATIDELEPDPPNTNLPTLDERTLVWTYPVDPAFVNYTPMFWFSNANPINGATVRVRDNGTATIPTNLFGDLPIVARFGRYYTNVQIQLGGTGTVTPVRVSVFVSFVDPSTGLTQDQAIFRNFLPNPGLANVGPVYCPPGSILAVGNDVVGGAGDTMAVRAQGVFHPKGTSIPMLPGVGVNIS